MSLRKTTFVTNKCIMRTEGLICRTNKELLSSELFAEVVSRFVGQLQKSNSVLLAIFGKEDVYREDVEHLVETLKLLGTAPAERITSIYPSAEVFLRNPEMLNDFVEGLYNFWRRFDRFLVCHSEINERVGLETKPYRVFNETVEQLTHLVRGAYRDIQENITGRHCRIYRQVCAGSQIGIIAVEKKWPCPGDEYSKLRSVPIIRQILLNPPLIIDPPTNKRTGEFIRAEENPLCGWEMENDEWLCYPAKVGPLLIHIFFHQGFIDLGCSLANLFDLAEDEDLERKPDAIYVYGIPEHVLYKYLQLPTVFFDDQKNNILVGAIPLKQCFGYFGYLKKMILTLHNIAMIKLGKMPYHGAMVHIILKDNTEAAVLLMGDTGAGKSETLEALRVFGQEHIRDMVIIADDMGSLEIDSDGKIVGYGTETGAFVRLDDLQPGYAFGQIDRAIIMSPQKVNARTVIPVTTIANVLRGYKVDFILYANNYEQVDDEHPVIERLRSAKKAIHTFSEGTVMAKGTTTSTGIVHTYFANVFGPSQCRHLHDKIAEKYFHAAFESGVFVGQIRTRLGISGWESKGPEEGAKELLRLISSQK